MTDDLFVFFPQWQGSGPHQELHAGAWAIKELCPAIPFREVPIETEPASGLRHGIFGHDTIQRQQEAARRLVEDAAPRRIFSLGGDCGIELVPVSWLNRACEGRLALVWLDAHGDLNTPETSPSKHLHGMPLRLLLSGPPHPFSSICFSRLHPSQVLLAGTRALDDPEDRYLQESGIRLLPVAALEADPSTLSCAAVLRGARGVYLHIDLDVLDPAESPDVLCPAPGGLRLETLRSMVRSIKNGCPLVGCSILEYVDRSGGAGAAAVRDLVQETVGDWLG